MCKSKIKLKGMARITGLLLAAGCMAADLQAADIEWKSMMTVAERKRDAQGQLQPLQSYDETIRRGMEFLLKDHLKWFKGPPATLLDEQGNTQMPWVYYSNLQQDGTPFAGAADGFVSYPAFHHALLIRTFIGYSKYANDQRPLKEAVKLADWNIAHSTPADWPYAGLPYSTFEAKKPGGFRDGSGLMPDKAAIMALAYLDLHEAGGEVRFRQAAEAIGKSLSLRQREDGTWPFRVDPKTEAVIEDYSSSVIYAVMLFEKLDKLNGNHGYQACRDRTWNWLLNGPIKTKEFRGFYEDIPASKDGRTNYDCLDTIRYLLANRTDTNGYLDMAKDLNTWIEKTFMDKIKGFEPAEGIREQLQCNVVMGIHSLNWASMLLELSKATGDETLRQRAIQTANYITYYLQPDNRIVVGFQYNQWWYSCHAGVILYLLNFAETAPTEMKAIAFEDVAPDGLLKARAELSLRRLQEPYFQWDNVSRVNFGAFPGDALGRTINGLTLLSQALNQPEPASLKEIMRRVPSLANPDGYLGPKLPESRANEDTMAGHNGYTYGLMEYALWTKDPETKESLRRMVANLFVPARAAIAGYRETSEAKVDWHLSGGDVGQLFTTLDGMTRAYALVPSPEFKATIETAIERYRKLDLVGLSAQTHAMLSAATGILRWYDMHHRPGDLAFAKALYKQYRALAMTETFENYNWFNKPQWTEACGVIDSFILTVNLWRLTGRADYMEDAHLILFNGLLPGQLQNGGFGTGPCVGHATGACRTKMHSEAPFCCSMRGGEALARAIQYTYFQNKDTVVLPFYANGMATLRFAEGTCKVRQETGYPHQGQVRLEVMESQVNKEKTWRFFVPSWAVMDSFEIRVNGKKSEVRLVDSFAEIAVRPVAGTIIEVVFQQERGPRPAVQSSQAPGASQYFSGPLLLGSATDNAAEPLVPILDLLGPGGRGGEPYVYFPNGKPQPAANAAAARKAPNLADTAQLFRRDLPPAPLPREIAKLFSALKQDKTWVISGFAWSGPQQVRQVVLLWPESGVMPGPEAIELRWSAAGEVHTAAQPGIIGNGRQWIYTLGKAPEGAAVDGLVLAGESAKEIPDALAVPVVEVLGNSPVVPSKRESDGNKPTAPNRQALPQQSNTALNAGQWAVFETSFASTKNYDNPFTEVEVDVVFQQGDNQWKVPAFWAGDKKWTVRFAPPVQGKFTYRVECTDKANPGLNRKEQTLSVAAYKGDNPLLKHGFVQVSPGKTYFEHADGTPFFWLADTWWKNLCKRMTWEGFQELTADRKAKGFSVVQICGGPYPDENFFAPSLENEGGQPYLGNDMSVVNPKYFDYADRRFKHLVDSGIVPAIVGAWGRGDCNSMDKFGAEKIKRHWRYLVARYGAYPVIWILAGEIPEETKAGKGPWAEVATYLRSIDPYRHPLTCHTGHGRKLAKDDVPVIDFDMVGGNHDEHVAVAPQSVAIVSSACATKPPMPVLVGETCYEGHMQQGFGDVQRRMFWQSILSGAAGHTYGAAGIWHAGVEGDHGNWGAWGRQPYDYTTWKEGMNYPGATQLGLGRKLLEQYQWQKFEPHPEWAPGCYAAGIPGGTRFIYRPRKGIYDWSGFTVNNLVPGVPYVTFFFDPATGRRFDKGIVTPTSTSWNTPNVPSPQDWVLVMEAPDMGAPVILPGAMAGKAYTGRLLPEGAVFASRTGPGWLTIQPDGRVSGTPGEDDAGANAWIVSVTKAGSPSAMSQLQITVAGAPGVHFSEKFNRYSGNQNATQDQSGLKVAHSGTVAGWTYTGAGAMHAVDRANQTGQSNPSDWGIMIFEDNVITSKAFAANVAGQTYRVNCELSAAAFNESSQATKAGDALLIEVLRADNSVLASTTKAPGAWTGKMTFTPASFEFKGDGSGDLRLRIGPAGAGKSGRFHGAIDNLIIKKEK